MVRGAGRGGEGRVGDHVQPRDPGLSAACTAQHIHIHGLSDMTRGPAIMSMQRFLPWKHVPWILCTAKSRAVDAGAHPVGCEITHGGALMALGSQARPRMAHSSCQNCRLAIQDNCLSMPHPLSARGRPHWWHAVVETLLHPGCARPV